MPFGVVRYVEGPDLKGAKTDRGEACDSEPRRRAVRRRGDAVPQPPRTRQNATHTCKPAQVIPLTGPEPAAKLFIDAPLAEPLASRGVVVIPYCAENMHIAPVFGPGALSVSPRVGHIHVTVDEAPWRWADASGTRSSCSTRPAPVLIELVNANHQVVDKGMVKFEVPPRASTP